MTVIKHLIFTHKIPSEDILSDEQIDQLEKEDALAHEIIQKVLNKNKDGE